MSFLTAQDRSIARAQMLATIFGGLASDPEICDLDTCYEVAKEYVDHIKQDCNLEGQWLSKKFRQQTALAPKK